MADERVLILGASGMLGSTLAPNLRERGYLVETHGRKGDVTWHCDCEDADAVARLCETAQPTVIVNLVALTNVDECERKPNLSYLINVRTVENVVKWIRNTGQKCHLIHVSTDHVYDGFGPHLEDDITLTNYYAFSKYAGELACREVPSTVIRTNFIGRSRQPGRISLTDWLYQSLSTRSPIQVFSDVQVSPLSIATLTEIIAALLKAKLNGVYNVGSRDGMSKADLAFSFAAAIGAPVVGIKRVLLSEAGVVQTYRPKDMRMDVLKIETALDLHLPQMSTEIKRAAQDYHASS